MQQLIAKMEVVVDANQNPEVNLISSYKFNQGENLHKKPQAQSKKESTHLLTENETIED